MPVIEGAPAPIIYALGVYAMAVAYGLYYVAAPPDVLVDLGLRDRLLLLLPRLPAVADVLRDPHRAHVRRGARARRRRARRSPPRPRRCRPRSAGPDRPVVIDAHPLDVPRRRRARAAAAVGRPAAARRARRWSARTRASTASTTRRRTRRRRSLHAGDARALHAGRAVHAARSRCSSTTGSTTTTTTTRSAARSSPGRWRCSTAPGYRTITIAQYLRFRAGDTAGPAAAADPDHVRRRAPGLATAAPTSVLAQHGMHAVMYVITAPVKAGNAFHLSWSELHRMQRLRPLGHPAARRTTATALIVTDPAGRRRRRSTRTAATPAATASRRSRRTRSASRPTSTTSRTTSRRRASRRRRSPCRSATTGRARRTRACEPFLDDLLATQFRVVVHPGRRQRPALHAADRAGVPLRAVHGDDDRRAARAGSCATTRRRAARQAGA